MLYRIIFSLLTAKPQDTKQICNSRRLRKELQKLLSLIGMYISEQFSPDPYRSLSRKTRFGSANGLIPILAGSLLGKSLEEQRLIPRFTQLDDAGAKPAFRHRVCTVDSRNPKQIDPLRSGDAAHPTGGCL